MGIAKAGDQVLVDGIVSVVVELKGNVAVLRDGRDVNGTDLFERPVQELEVLRWQTRGDDDGDYALITKKVALRPADQSGSSVD